MSNIKSFFNVIVYFLLLTISLYFSNNFFFIKKTYLASSKSLPHGLIFGIKTFLPSLEPVKYSKPSIPKEALLDTTILLISIQ